MIEQSRRGVLGFLGTGIIAAPAIVRAASIMPVRAIAFRSSLEKGPVLSLIEQWAVEISEYPIGFWRDRVEVCYGIAKVPTDLARLVAA